VSVCAVTPPVVVGVELEEFFSFFSPLSSRLLEGALLQRWLGSRGLNQRRKKRPSLSGVVFFFLSRGCRGGVFVLACPERTVFLLAVFSAVFDLLRVPFKRGFVILVQRFRIHGSFQSSDEYGFLYGFYRTEDVNEPR
jgi:hypothetical protein